MNGFWVEKSRPVATLTRNLCLGASSSGEEVLQGCHHGRGGARSFTEGPSGKLAGNPEELRDFPIIQNRGFTSTALALKPLVLDFEHMLG